MEHQTVNQLRIENRKTYGASRAWIAISALLLTALIVMIFLYINKGNDGKVVGEVNGVKITRNELYDEIVNRFGDAAYQVLDAMIMEKIVDIEAANMNIKITDEEIEEELDSLIEQYGTRQDFENALAYSGYSLDSFKDQIRLQLKLRKIFEPRIEIHNEQLVSFYEQNKEFYTTDEQVRASHILLDTLAEAESVLEQLNQGGDFAELAKTYSQDPGSRDQGGDLNYFGRGIMDPQFEQAALQLDVGEISDIVQSSHGYHIIKVVDKIEAKTPTLDEIRDRVEQEYFDEQMYAQFEEWLTDAKKKWNVVNHLE